MVNENDLEEILAQALPWEEAIPMLMFFSAPPKPPIA